MVNAFLNTFRFAASGGCDTQTGVLPSLYKGLTCVTDAAGNSNLKIAGLDDIFKIIGNIVQILLAVAGSIAIVVILLSAAYYVASAGDPGRVKKAKDLLLNTVIGLVIIIGSYAAIEFVAKGF